MQVPNSRMIELCSSCQNLAILLFLIVKEGAWARQNGAGPRDGSARDTVRDEHEKGASEHMQSESGEKKKHDLHLNRRLAYPLALCQPPCLGSRIPWPHLCRRSRKGVGDDVCDSARRRRMVLHVRRTVFRRPWQRRSNGLYWAV